MTKENDQPQLDRTIIRTVMNLDMEEILGADDPYVQEKREQLEQLEKFKKTYGTPEGIAELKIKLATAKSQYVNWKKQNPDQAELLEQRREENRYHHSIGLGIEAKERAKARRIRAMDKLSLTDKYLELINYDFSTDSLIPFLDHAGLEYTETTINLLLSLNEGRSRFYRIEGAKSDLNLARNYRNS